jgi:sirohydrochlorin cobaltochelatase
MDGYALRHAADENVGQLKLYTDPRAAREIARYDAEGKYRPLKTAPNLRRGWLLQTGSLEGLEMALEFFYPAALGLWLSWRQGTLAPTSFRETLGRQTGMYRVTQLITEEQSEDLVAHCCRSNGGCLRTILWEIKPGEPVRSLPEDKRTLAELPSDCIPLICREACNLIVAAARPIAKGNLPKTG